MTQSIVKKCPICGAALGLNGKASIDDETLAEMEHLKNKGLLSQTIVFAVTVVKSMNSTHPALFEDLLSSHDKNLSKEIGNKLEREIKPIAEALWELKGNPLVLGKIQEATVTKRLSALKLGQDQFSTYKATREGEDVECAVIEDAKTHGKIIIESKRTKKFCKGFVEQLKTYMRKENTPFGILATTSLPADALSYTTWMDGVLVVKLEFLESAYIFVREHAKLKRALEQDYLEKVRKVENKDQVLIELRNAIMNEQLDKIIKDIECLSDEIDQIANSLEKFPDRIRSKTEKMRRLTTRLVEEHVNTIRSKLTDN